MKATRNELQALAERVERGNGEDKKLSRAALHAIGQIVGNVSPADHVDPLLSLDAALSIVPKWAKDTDAVSLCMGQNTMAQWTAHVGNHEGWHDEPARALTAAALYAHAEAAR